MIQLQLAGKKLLTIESLFHLMWAKITRAAVECLCITEVNVRNYLGRPSEIRITGPTEGLCSPPQSRAVAGKWLLFQGSHTRIQVGSCD